MACSICQLEGHNRTTCPQKLLPEALRTIPPLQIKPEGFNTWDVVFDYEEQNNCDEGCDPYCHCGRITGGEVTEIPYWRLAESRTLLNRLPQNTCETFVLRSLFKSLRPSDFEVYGEADYYGESATVRFEQGALTSFTKFNAQETLLGKLGVALQKEYGYLPGWWSEVKDLKVQNIDPSSIHLSNPRLDKETMQRYMTDPNCPLLPGVVVRQTPQGYQVVDGNHRVQAAVSLAKPDLEVLVLCFETSVRDLLEELRQTYHQFVYAFSAAVEDTNVKPLAVDYLKEAQKKLSELEQLSE